MTNKIYRSAMGKTIDMGALLLQNEGTRAVGNMNVNARGDTVNSQNQVIETKNRQAQRQYAKQVAPASVQKPAAGNRAVKQARESAEIVETVNVDNYEDLPIDVSDTFADMPEDDVVQESPKVEEPLKGGLAGAIARSRVVQQEKEKPLREQQKSTIKKI